VDLELDGKKAVITGGSRGIGKAIALELASEGVDIAICSRSQEALESTAKEIRKKTGSSVFCSVADTTDEPSVSTFISESASNLGGIDILVNNAAAPGGLVMGTLSEASPEELLLDIDTKIVGYMRVAKHAAPHMTRQGWGRIINIGGLAARSGGAISGMRNIALTHFTKTLSNQLGPQGVTVNIIHPGATRTEQTEPSQIAKAKELGITVKEVEEQSASNLDIRRIVDSHEIAYLVAFIASQKAGAITGESIAAGGGAGSAVFP
jgi:NAD(P)-dependent dehydrogenase (short-subunit alcohol dehydrogenase family)